MGCYFLLIEEELRIRPTHGFIACGDGTPHRIDNTEELWAWVLELAGQAAIEGRGQPGSSGQSLMDVQYLKGKPRRAAFLVNGLVTLDRLFRR
jgi:hypothetical protein